MKKGGVERFAALLANHLVDRGMRVRMLMFKPDIEFNLDERVEITYINHKKFRSRFLSIVYVYLALLVKVWSMRPKRLITLSRIAGMFAAASFYPRTIVSFDTYPLSFNRYKQLQYLFFFNLPWIRRIVSCSEELRTDVEPYILFSKRMLTIPYPVPHLTVPDDRVHGRKFFVVVSRLHARKNVREIIRVYAEYGLKQHADLVICGDGVEMDFLRDLVDRHNLAPFVVLKGFVRDPYPFIKTSICLVSASMREGFPNVFVEALGLGTPIISSRAKTGPSEIISHGTNGLLFEVGDYAKLGEYMLELASNDELLRRLQSNTALGLEKYTYDAVMSKWMNVL
ncbi:MAG TPA: glycosyltransferase [Chryseolinea sp.]|nr:glycosyltransferase [Chryseolinea sp.]